MLSKSGCMGPRVARVDPDAAGGGGGTGGGDTGGGGGDTGGGGWVTRAAVVVTRAAVVVTRAAGGGDAGADAAKKAQAEGLNNEGKNLFRGADVPGAIAKFEAAAALVPDPRYHYNLCLSYESLKRYDDAILMCEKVAGSNPGKRLEDKATRRIGIIQTLKKKGQ